MSKIPFGKILGGIAVGTAFLAYKRLIGKPLNDLVNKEKYVAIAVLTQALDDYESDHERSSATTNVRYYLEQAEWKYTSSVGQGIESLRDNIEGDRDLASAFDYFQKLPSYQQYLSKAQKMT
jgi:hypothetical protein